MRSGDGGSTTTSLTANSGPERSWHAFEYRPVTIQVGSRQLTPIDANLNHPLRMREGSTRSIRVHWRSFAVDLSSYTGDSVAYGVRIGADVGLREARRDNHSRRVNHVFCDGHVESSATNQVYARIDQARRRWNNDNEPHPETWWTGP